MAASPALAHLEAIPFFRGLNPAERRRLAPLCRVVVHARGDVVFAEGDRPVELSFVAFGVVKIVKSGSERDAIIAIAGAGDPIGIVAAFEAAPYPASAVVLVPATVLSVPEREFQGLVNTHSELVRQLLRISFRRQAETARRLAEMSGPVEERIARVFLILAERHGERVGDSLELPLPLSRQDLADLAGTTVETAIRVMSRWGKDGLVKTHDGGFTIQVARELRHVADGLARAARVLPDGDETDDRG